jgi:hypothetical protein
MKEKLQLYKSQCRECMKEYKRKRRADAKMQ